MVFQNIISKQKYNRITQVIRQFRGLSKDCLPILKESFPGITTDALKSILSLEYQNRMKSNFSKTPQAVERYYNQYIEAIRHQEEPGIIIRMAKDYDICPCLIAKLILQKYFEIKDAEASHSENQPNVNVYIRNTALIPDTDLAYEVYLCTIYDDQYSPLVEILKNSLGQEYEIKLENDLMNLGLAFRTEEYLRQHGYDKTPDIKLDVPVMVDGVVINWVESKALFGAEEVHQEYIKNQYLSYWNRFGPGLVIYWFGFVSTLLHLDEKRFIVKDHFPKDVISITSLDDS